MSNPALFQCMIGMQCNDFAMIASDQTSTMSIMILQNDVDKLIPVANNLILGMSGNSGDMLQFSQFISNNLELYKVKNGYQLDTPAAVHFTRKALADLSKQDLTATLQLSLLLAGWDEENGGQLYMVDPFAACVRVPFAAQGFGGVLGVSILEYYHRPDMTESRAYEVIQMSVKAIQERSIFNLPNFQVKVVSKNGITTLPVISTQRIAVSPGLEIKPDVKDSENNTR
ncbi:proteasome subunit domain-containing protein [Phthorimaea operculella]|nr:proteasome subunit domain-containing protein [Phthorimaea operculella]